MHRAGELTHYPRAEPDVFEQYLPIHKRIFFPDPNTNALMHGLRQPGNPPLLFRFPCTALEQHEFFEHRDHNWICYRKLMLMQLTNAYTIGEIRSADTETALCPKLKRFVRSSAVETDFE